MDEQAMVRRMAESVLKCAADYRASNKDFDEVLKRRKTDVTRKIDMVAEEALNAAILREGISARVISEELGERLVPANKEPQYTLVLDPIDGSTNIVLGIPYFCTSLALSKKSAGATFSDIDAGAVAGITVGTFHASRGNGAYLGGDRIRTSESKGKPRYAIYSYGVGSVPKGVVDLEEENCVVRTMGSIAMDISMVARGAFDAVIDTREMLSGYDVMASSLILKEAGGVITYINGNPLDSVPVNVSGISILGAADAEVHGRLLKYLNGP